MKITHIHIERFRGFQNEDFEVGSLLTAIAGQNGTQLRNYRWKNMTIRKKYRLKGWIFKDTTVKWTYSSTRTNPVPTITEDWIWSVSRNTTNISTVCQYYWAEPYNKRAANNMAYCSRLR